jgi:Ca-activated chloride channel family protein
VKDSNGQVVKSKLDVKRLKEIAEATGGFYLHLDDGPRTMKALFNEGLEKMQTGEIDDRMARRPIERYQWPLAAALLALTLSYLVRERKRMRALSVSRIATKRAVAAAALLLALAGTCLAAAPGLDAYRNDKYSEAYQEFEKTLKEHPNTHAADKIEFDAGAAAYKMGDYNKALEWFSRSLLSKDKTLQEKSHFNIGRTLEERADRAQTNEKALGDLANAQSHYEEALKIDPNDERAKANLEEVKKKIERLKQNPPKQPSPPPQSQKDKQQPKDQPKDQQQQKDEQKKQDQQDQKDRQEKSDDKNKKDEPKAGETPSPSPGGEQQQQQQPQNQASPSPSAGQDKGKDQKKEQESPSNGDENASPSPPASASASPSPEESGSPSPSPGAGDEAQPSASPSASASASPQKKLSGDVKGAGEEKPNQPPQSAEAAPAEPEKEGQMSEKQAQLLLQSMKDEEQRVQLDERKAARHVYKDW